MRNNFFYSSNVNLVTEMQEVLATLKSHDLEDIKNIIKKIPAFIEANDVVAEGGLTLAMLRMDRIHVVLNTRCNEAIKVILPQIRNFIEAKDMAKKDPLALKVLRMERMQIVLSSQCSHAIHEIHLSEMLPTSVLSKEHYLGFAMKILKSRMKTEKVIQFLEQLAKFPEYLKALYQEHLQDQTKYYRVRKKTLQYIFIDLFKKFELEYASETQFSAANKRKLEDSTPHPPAKAPRTEDYSRNVSGVLDLKKEMHEILLILREQQKEGIEKIIEKIPAFVEANDVATQDQPAVRAGRFHVVLSSCSYEAVRKVVPYIQAFIEATEIRAEERFSVRMKRIRAVLSTRCSKAAQETVHYIQTFIEATDVRAEEQQEIKIDRIKAVLGSRCPNAIKEILPSIRFFIEANSLSSKCHSIKRFDRIKVVLNSQCSLAINKITSQDLLPTPAILQQDYIAFAMRVLRSPLNIEIVMQYLKKLAIQFPEDFKALHQADLADQPKSYDLYNHGRKERIRSFFASELELQRKNNLPVSRDSFFYTPPPSPLGFLDTNLTFFNFDVDDLSPH